MKLNQFKCNRCGVEFSAEDCDNNPFSIDHKFGYSSAHDGERFAPDFCPECADIIADSIERQCQIPPFSAY
jgi:hypothetical protein